MSKYSDAALLKGDYIHLAAQLREGRAAADKKVNWSEAACDNKAEEAAQEIAKHIFAFNKSLDPEKEEMEILSYSAVGPLKVLAIVPGEEGDLLRIDGLVMPNERPASVVIHASQLALTFTRIAAKTKSKDEESYGAKIGFVIFDDLKDRRKARYKKAAAAKRAAAKKKKAPTMARLKAAAKKAATKKPAKKAAKRKSS